jgi:hypothetical protein
MIYAPHTICQNCQNDQRFTKEEPKQSVGSSGFPVSRRETHVQIDDIVPTTACLKTATVETPPIAVVSVDK